MACRLRSSAARPDSVRRGLQLEEAMTGLLPTRCRQLKQLKEENTKLKKLVAELSLDKEMLQNVIRRRRA